MTKGGPDRPWMGPKRSTEAERRMAAIHSEQSKLLAQKAALAPWLELDLPLETQSTHQIMIQLGTLPANRPFEEGEQAVQGAGELVQLTQISADRELRYCLLVCHTSQEEGALEALKALGWSPCQSAGLDGDGGRKHGPAGPGAGGVGQRVGPTGGETGLHGTPPAPASTAG